MEVTFIYLDDNNDLIQTINEISRGSAKIVELNEVEVEVKTSGSDNND